MEKGSSEISTLKKEKEIKKSCSGNCGPNCCQISGGQCCGGDGHKHDKEEREIASSK